MDTDRIPTEPTTDDEPPSVTSLTPGPSQAPMSPAAGRGRRTAAIGLGVVLVLVATFSAGIGIGRMAAPTGNASGPVPSPASGPGPSGTVPTDFALIRDAWDVLHEQYVGRSELDDRALIYGAIRGMTEAVGDTGHTDFMTPEERAARNDALAGSYVGIGVRIDTDDAGLPTVVGVFPGSPAEAAGLQAGETIVAVDDRPTAGETLDTVAGWVRGEAGTVVRVTLRDAAGAERTLSITRADVPVDPVSWTVVPGTRIALIRLDQFSSGAADEMVATLRAAREAGADRVVLDLRGNPGGYVNEAVGIASQFLREGVVYVDRDAQGTETPHAVTAGGVALDLPLVVLVDGSTASSAEIVAGALQDADRATIVGETTYGTGTVLSEFALRDGSALRVGTVEWLTPSGRRIWHEGIAPDVEVTRPEDVVPLLPDDVRSFTPTQVDALADPQLARALELVATEAIAQD
ncbi:MAG: S41 family peptidase [Candidatus Limnocylindria bacterium]